MLWPFSIVCFGSDFDWESGMSMTPFLYLSMGNLEQRLVWQKLLLFSFFSLSISCFSCTFHVVLCFHVMFVLKLHLIVVTECDLMGGQRERIWMPRDPSHWLLPKDIGPIVDFIVMNVGKLSKHPCCFSGVFRVRCLGHYTSSCRDSAV